jgi:hypothetical protein
MILKQKYTPTFVWSGQSTLRVERKGYAKAKDEVKKSLAKPDDFLVTAGLEAYRLRRFARMCLLRFEFQ